MYEGGGQLTKAMKSLIILWEETKTSWDDVKQRQFEERYIVPLQSDLRNALTAMGTMSALLARIRRECT
jgi:hypothetical protein